VSDHLGHDIDDNEAQNRPAKYEGNFGSPEYVLTGGLSFVPGAVVQGVLDLAGLTFDAEGRLL
jgi:hypothetical protein